MESKTGDELDWHAEDSSEVLNFFGTDETEGLTSERVEELREQYGTNELSAKEHTPLWELILEQFEDPLVITLLVAAGISAGTGLWDHYNPEDGESQHGSVLEAMVEPIVILVILFFNAFVGVWQESNAENALEALKSLQSEHATVVRDGQVQQIEAVDVVPGDLFIVQVGDRVPADGRVVRLETTTLRIEQASLTGESETVLKDYHSVPALADITSKTNMLFSSTGVAGGRAVAVATSTGMSTELGKVQSAVQEADEDEDTPLKKKIGVFGYQLQVVIFVICVLVWVINYFNFFDEDGNFSVKRCLYYLKIAVALAVAAIPEGLPAVITTCLALGTRKMAKKNAIVRKLPSVETLGCTTVICSDKTGTLTTNEMSVVRLVYFDDHSRLQSHVVHGTSYDPTLGGVDGIEGFEEVDIGISNISQVASLCNDARITYEDGKFKRLGQPTEAALKVVAEKLGVPGSGRADPGDKESAACSVSDHWTSSFNRVATLEFSRDRKSMGVILAQNGATGIRTRRRSTSPGQSNILMVKGAPESVIDRCTKIRCADGSTAPLTPTIRARLLKENDSMAGDALRCIALAIRDDGLPYDLDTYDGSEDHPAHAVLRDDSSFVRIESDLTFVGLTGIIDPPRPEVRGSMELCAQAGIRVIVITGDNKKTAESVCRNIGIFDDTESLEGKSFIGREFMELSEADQMRALFSDDGGRVFSRAEPAHKQVIIKLLKSNDQVTAMTGDGVNDAPALKAADIGIAMGISGTEVAKEASDMILADDNFATIVSAVEEGRSIYNNTKAFIRYLISSNIGEVACIFITAAMGLPEIMVPVQLLWVNLVTDGPPATALGFNPADAMIMKIPPRRSDDQLISAWVFFRYMVIGLYVGFATVGIFIYWFCYYDYAADGHDLITLTQLRNWVSCTPAALLDESSMWFGFTIENSGGIDLGGNSCNYFSDGKLTAATLSLSVLVTIEMLNALNALSEDGSLVSMPPWCNPWLLVAMTVSMLLHCVILYIPAAASIFGVMPLDGQDWLLVFYFSVPVIFIDEILKLFGRMQTNAAMAQRLKDKHV